MLIFLCLTWPLSSLCLPASFICLISLSQDICSILILLTLIQLGPIICSYILLKLSLFEYSTPSSLLIISVLVCFYSYPIQIPIGCSINSIIIGSKSHHFLLLIVCIIITYKVVKSEINLN